MQQNTVSRRNFVAGSAAIAAGAAVAGRLLAADQAWAAGASAAADASAAGEQPETQILVDQEGNEVEIPWDPQNIAITSWKGSIAALVLLGEYKRIKICCDTARYPWLRHALPGLEDLPDLGSFNDVSIEEMVKAWPDVVISPVRAADANAKMKELGLTVYVDGGTPEDADDVFATEMLELTMAAEMTHTEAKLAKYVEWNDALMAEVEERVKDIPDDERKRVLVVRSNMEEVFCANISLGHTVTLAGGKLVTDEMNEYYTEVDSEQVVKWAPEFIFQQLVTIDTATAAGRYLEWAADERYVDLPAIQTGDVYMMPMGIAQWGGDIESGLGMLLMGKLMYPDRFEDMDVLELAKEFYKTFMEYDFDEDDYPYLFIDMEGANPLGVVK